MDVKVVWPTIVAHDMAEQAGSLQDHGVTRLVWRPPTHTQSHDTDKHTHLLCTVLTVKFVGSNQRCAAGCLRACSV